MNHPESQRLHALDAVRGFALLLGVAFHAALSFMPGWPPGIWSMVDNSPSQFLSDAGFVSHIFRMSLFFFIAGFFGRLLYHKLGARGFWANRAKRIVVPLIVGWVILLPADHLRLVHGHDQDVRRHAAGDAARCRQVAGCVSAHAPVVPVPVAAAVRRGHRAARPRRALRRAHRSCAAWSTRWSSTRCACGSRVFTLGIPVAGALMALPLWFYWQGIPTPDRSLIPQVPATVGFGTAFVFGWLVNRADGALAAITRGWFAQPRARHASPRAG